MQGSNGGDKKIGTCSLTLLQLSWFSYLVSGSFDQAVLTAFSVSDQIRAANRERVGEDDELLEMLELVGIVLVQALKELRR